MLHDKFVFNFIQYVLFWYFCSRLNWVQDSPSTEQNERVWNAPLHHAISVALWQNIYLPNNCRVWCLLSQILAILNTKKQRQMHLLRHSARYWNGPYGYPQWAGYQVKDWFPDFLKLAPVDATPSLLCPAGLHTLPPCFPSCPQHFCVLLLLVCGAAPAASPPFLTEVVTCATTTSPGCSQDDSGPKDGNINIHMSLPWTISAQSRHESCLSHRSCTIGIHLLGTCATNSNTLLEFTLLVLK